MRFLLSRGWLLGTVFVVLSGCQYSRFTVSSNWHLPRFVAVNSKREPPMVRTAPAPIGPTLPPAAPSPTPPAGQPGTLPIQKLPAVHSFDQPRQPITQTAYAPDHHWLIGNLERDEAHGRWFLRYALPGENDCYHGRLELFLPRKIDGLHSGQRVRVEGIIMDRALLDPQPVVYCVQHLQPLMHVPNALPPRGPR